jgi:hypothetical protein
MNDMAGKAVRATVECIGKVPRYNFTAGVRECEGENGAAGPSDIEDKTTRAGASERSRGDASDIDGQNREVEWAGAHESVWATNEFQSH